MFQSYDYFSLGMSFFQIPDSFRDLTQRVAPVDNRSYFAGFQEPLHGYQVLFARMCQKWEQLLAHEPR